jgi:hypothetical protein
VQDPNDHDGSLKRLVAPPGLSERAIHFMPSLQIGKTPVFSMLRTKHSQFAFLLGITATQAKPV